MLRLAPRRAPIARPAAALLRGRGLQRPIPPSDPALDILFVGDPERASPNLCPFHTRSGAVLRSVRRLALRYEKGARPPPWLLRGEPVGPNLDVYADFIYPRPLDGSGPQGGSLIGRLVQLLKWPEYRADFQRLKSTANLETEGQEAEHREGLVHCERTMRENPSTGDGGRDHC